MLGTEPIRSYRVLGGNATFASRASRDRHPRWDYGRRASNRVPVGRFGTPLLNNGRLLHVYPETPTNATGGATRSYRGMVVCRCRVSSVLFIGVSVPIRVDFGDFHRGVFRVTATRDRVVFRSVLAGVFRGQLRVVRLNCYCAAVRSM